jgi:exonuclease SbcC
LRPLKLTMQAFGPYAEREEIDFRCLGDRSFFLIHGPTGGGKTTILDAMCFALYGDTSGDVRRGKDMRSHHAAPETVTEVMFEFSLGETRYRIHRVPEQERPMKRGGGTTIQKPEATLWRLGSVGGRDEERTIETQWSRVTGTVGRILGFRSDQFRQVVVLPQGKFQDVLTASSKEREDILEILFRTDVYRKIEEALKAAARELTDKMEDLNKHRAFILGRAPAADAGELERRVSQLAAELAQAEEDLERLHADEARVQARLQAARQLHAAFAEHREAEQELARFMVADGEMAREKERLRLARRAAGLAGVAETLSERLAEVEEGRGNLEEASRRLEEAGERKSEAARALGREKRREAKRTAANKKLLRLESQAGQMEQLEDARTSMAETQDEMAGLRGRVREGTRSVDGITRRIESLEESSGQTREKAAQAPALLLRLDISRKHLEVRQKLETVRAQAREGRRVLKRLEKEAKEAQGRHDEARSLLTRMEERWRSGQAGVLAGRLRSGEPCPVCGSTEHPSPAVLPPDVPDHDGLREQRTVVEKAEKERDRTREALSARRLDVSRLEGEAMSLRQNLGEAGGLTLKSVRSETRKLEKGLEGAEAAQQALKEALADLDRLRQQKDEMARHLKAEEAALKQAENAFEGARAVAAERESKLPKALRTRARLEAALEQARLDLASLVDAFEKARQRESDARQQYAEAKVAAAGARKALRTATRNSLTARERFSKKLAAAGFTGPDAYEKARLEDTEIESLARAVDEHEAGLKAARLRLTRARQATRGKKIPDLAGLASKTEEAKHRCDKRIAEAAEIRKEHGRVAGLAGELKTIERDITALEKRYYVTGKIADVANGKNDRGITFQRFVLAALLDEVLMAATERLKVMSHGRYDLHRASERADRRLAGGLDLEVFDAFTGYARPVSTLSGGETFLSSLSLALGLADVVQAYAGGIHLETIFVDEGFGSLDPEALDLAIRALMDLQRGNRLVGIISHVPELKEWIDARLEVTGTPRGSKVRFVGLD